MDIIIAQGGEAGRHSGEVGSIVRWPQVVTEVAPVPALHVSGMAVAATHEYPNETVDVAFDPVGGVVGQFDKVEKTSAVMSAGCRSTWTRRPGSTPSTRPRASDPAPSRRPRLPRWRRRAG